MFVAARATRHGTDASRYARHSSMLDGQLTSLLRRETSSNHVAYVRLYPRASREVCQSQRRSWAQLTARLGYRARRRLPVSRTRRLLNLALAEPQHFPERERPHEVGRARRGARTKTHHQRTSDNGDLPDACERQQGPGVQDG